MDNKMMTVARAILLAACAFAVQGCGNGQQDQPAQGSVPGKAASGTTNSPSFASQFGAGLVGSIGIPLVVSGMVDTVGRDVSPGARRAATKEGLLSAINEWWNGTPEDKKPNAAK